MRIHAVFTVAILALVLFTASVGASVSDSSVSNTNVYAGSNAYSIAPADNVTTSTAVGITNTANRYIYASALDNSVNESTATLILLDRQGAAVNINGSSVVSGITVDWGDGTTDSSLTHVYSADGIYNVTLTATNYLDQTGITLTDRVQIGETSISITVSPNTLTTGKSWTLTANAVIADSIQWQVSRNNASWTNIPAGTYTPTEYGQYFFRAIAYGASATAYSNVVQTTYQYAVTNSVVSNTNVYAGSNAVSIAPSGYVDTASTASGITNVANRYIYATGLSVTETGATAQYSLSGLQGSTTILADRGTAQGWFWEYGDGQSLNTTVLSHKYGQPGRYVANLTLTNYLDSNGVTVSTGEIIIGPILSGITVSPTIGGLRTVFELTGSAEAYTSWQWQMSRDNVAWQTIAGSNLTETWSAGYPGTYYFRAVAANSSTGLQATSNSISVDVYRAPALGTPTITPAYGPLQASVTLWAGVEDPGIAQTQYQWQVSTDGGTTYTDISGATSQRSSVSVTFDAAGKYYFRLAATGSGGTSYSPGIEYRAYAAPEFSSVTVSPDKGGAPLKVLLAATASDATGYRWEYSTGSGVWLQVAKSAAAYYTIPADGTYYFRAVASGFGGTTYSQSIEVNVGQLPTAQITTPQYDSMVFETGTSVSFAAADAGSGITYSWDFGDGATQSGQTVTHTYASEGSYTVVLSVTNQFGTSQARLKVVISNSTGDIILQVSEVSSEGATLTGIIQATPVDAGTQVWFEIRSESGQLVWKSAKMSYNGATTYQAYGMPLLSGQLYSAIVYSNSYGYSLPQIFQLQPATGTPHETLGTAWEDGLSRNPFNISALLDSGIGALSGPFGGGSLGSAVAFGVIALFIVVGLWLRQQDVVVPLTLSLIAGWFIVGNLPGEWQPIAYTLIVVSVVAIFFYLFRKRVE